MKHLFPKLRDVTRCFVSRRRYSAHLFALPQYVDRLKRFNMSENYREDLARVIELVRPRPGMRVLDFGCGLGVAAAVFADHGCIVTGVDVSAPMLTIAASMHPNVRFGSPEDVESGQDAAITLHVLAFVPDLRSALRAMYRALRPGGHIVLCEPNSAYTLAMLPANLVNSYLPDETSYRFSSARELRIALREVGFDRITCETHGEYPAPFRFDALRSRLILTAVK